MDHFLENLWISTESSSDQKASFGFGVSTLCNEFAQIVEKKSTNMNNVANLENKQSKKKSE